MRAGAHASPQALRLLPDGIFCHKTSLPLSYRSGRPRCLWEGVSPPPQSEASRRTPPEPPLPYNEGGGQKVPSLFIPLTLSLSKDGPPTRRSCEGRNLDALRLQRLPSSKRRRLTRLAPRLQGSPEGRPPPSKGGEPLWGMCPQFSKNIPGRGRAGGARAALPPGGWAQTNVAMPNPLTLSPSKGGRSIRGDAAPTVETTKVASKFPCRRRVADVVRQAPTSGRGGWLDAKGEGDDCPRHGDAPGDHDEHHSHHHAMEAVETRVDLCFQAVDPGVDAAQGGEGWMSPSRWSSCSNAPSSLLTRSSIVAMGGHHTTDRRVRARGGHGAGKDDQGD